jgi:hypothetical protein
MPIVKNTFTNDFLAFRFTPHYEYAIAYSFSIHVIPSYHEMASSIAEFIYEINTNYSDINYIVNYDGTKNPVFAKAMLQTVTELGLYHSILYDGNLINDTTDFLNNTVVPCCVSDTGWECQTESSFAECSICVAIRPNCTDTIPWRYYIIDENDAIVSEQIEKPYSGKFIRSVSLREKFNKGLLKFVNNSLVFVPSTENSNSNE